MESSLPLRLSPSIPRCHQILRKGVAVVQFGIKTFYLPFSPLIRLPEIEIRHPIHSESDFQAADKLWPDQG